MNDNLALWGLFLLGVTLGALLVACALIPAYKLGVQHGRQAATMSNLSRIATRR